VPNGISAKCHKRTLGSQHSIRHVLELREVERLRPVKTAFGEHFEHRFDALRIIQATDRDEDRPRKALQVVGKHPGAAIGAEVPLQPPARLRDVLKRFRLATYQREIILRHAEECGCFAARSLFAVQAVANRNERRICVELELDLAAYALSRMLLCRVVRFLS